MTVALYTTTTTEHANSRQVTMALIQRARWNGMQNPSTLTALTATAVGPRKFLHHQIVVTRMRDRSEQWAPGLMRDALYEYTLSSDCVGGDVKYLRRRPAIAIPATSWEPTTKQLYMDAQAETLCPACNGNGAVSNMDPFGGETTYECPDCRGHGVRLSHDAAPGGDA